jgi:hypothetical protein
MNRDAIRVEVFTRVYEAVQEAMGGTASPLLKVPDDVQHRMALMSIMLTKSIAMARSVGITPEQFLLIVNAQFDIGIGDAAPIGGGN